MIPDLVPLAHVAERLHMKPERLREMARKGKFPEISNPDRGHYLVRVGDVERWLAGTWTNARLAMVHFRPLTKKGGRRG